MCEALNGANSIMMVSVIMGMAVREETTSDKTFDLVKWIRDRKLQCFGHILWIVDGSRTYGEASHLRDVPHTPHKQEIW